MTIYEYFYGELIEILMNYDLWKPNNMKNL